MTGSKVLLTPEVSELIPPEYAIVKWLKEAFVHGYNNERFTSIFGLKPTDTYEKFVQIYGVEPTSFITSQIGLRPTDCDPSERQRPHDLAGTGNKVEWEQITRFALQYVEPLLKEYEEKIVTGIKLHKDGQYNHLIWDGRVKTSDEEAYVHDMKGCALDSVLSLIEYRGYHGGPFSYDEIPEVFVGNEEQKRYVMDIIPEMKKVGDVIQPTMKEFSISSLPKGEIHGEMHDAIWHVFKKTVEMLRNRGYKLHSIKI